MKHLALLFVLCTLAHAETPPATPPSIAVHFEKSQYEASLTNGQFDVNMLVDNPTDHPIEIVAVGMNSWILTLKVDPSILVEAGKTVKLAYRVNESALRVGTPLFANVEVKDQGKTRLFNAVAQLVIKGAPELKPATLDWRVGDPLDEKQIHIVFPGGQKLTSATLVGPPHFELRVDTETNTLYLKPLTTSTATGNGIIFTTEPALDPRLIITAGAVITSIKPTNNKR